MDEQIISDLYKKPIISDEQNDIKYVSKLLITKENIDYLNQKQKRKINYNIKRLLNNPNLTQPQLIYFGILFQKHIINLVKSLGYKTLYDENLVQLFNNENKKVKNKGKKDIDLCFVIDNIIYYFEIKTNLYLDTEKSYVSDKKMRLLSEYISSQYPEYKLEVCCLTAWYEKEKDMTIRPHYKICFMNEFYNIIGLTKISKDDHQNMLHELGEKIIKIEVDF